MTAARRNRSNLATISLIAAAAAGLLTAVITTTATRLNRNNQHLRRLLTNSVDDATAAAAPTDYHKDEPSTIQEGSLISMQFTADPYVNRDKIEMIKLGEAKLASLRLLPNSLSEDGSGPPGRYTGVYGTFCVFDDQMNKKDPAVYPTVDHMMETSDHCIENRYTLPLNEVVEAVTSHDKNADRNERLKRLPISGLLFHQGFSGAGLIANALTTFDNTVVLSEHSAIRDALNACDYIHNRFNSNDCSSSKHQKLVQDVISLLSRTSDSNIEHMYLKLDSASSTYIPLLRSIYPYAKWTFDYRNADHVLAKSTEPKRTACMLYKRQPSSVMAFHASDHNLNLEELSTHEVCALHLSTLLDVASKEHESTGTGMLISYEDDLLKEDAFIETILPYLGLQKEIDANPILARARVEQVLSTKASVRGIHSQDIDNQWGGEEHVHVSEEVRAASQLFMKSTM
jgi:hypothetical protein